MRDHEPLLPGRRPSPGTTGNGEADTHRLVLMLEDSPLFENFSRDELGHLAAYLRTRRVAKDTVLYRASDFTDYLAVVVAGRLRACRDIAVDGGCALVARGDCCGEAGLVQQRAQDRTVIALDASEVAILDADALSRLRARWPQLGSRLVRAIARQLTRHLRSGDTQTDPLAV